MAGILTFPIPDAFPPVNRAVAIMFRNAPHGQLGFTATGIVRDLHLIPF